MGTLTSVAKKPEEFDAYQWNGTLDDAIALVGWMESFEARGFYGSMTYMHGLDGDSMRPFINCDAGIVHEEKTTLREGDIILRSRETKRFSLSFDEDIAMRFRTIDP